MGYVYLLFCVNKDGSEGYKIGVTKNDPIKRVKQLSTGNPSKIELLKHYKSENYFKVEKSIHRLYASQKTSSDNEWFILEDEHVLTFLDECKKVDDIIDFMLKNNHFYN